MRRRAQRAREAARRAAQIAEEAARQKDEKENDPNAGNTSGPIAGNTENFDVSTNQLEIRF